MKIKVKLFASLRERLGFADQDVEVADGHTVGDVWNNIAGTNDLPDNIMAAVNMDYVRPDTRVADGDEVAFFPPVTGG